MKCAKSQGSRSTAVYDDEAALRCIENLPVKGKKKPSATILARLLVVGLERAFSTAMRVENVRDDWSWRTEGPRDWEAMDSVIGWSIVSERVEVSVEIALFSRACAGLRGWVEGEESVRSDCFEDCGVA